MKRLVIAASFCGLFAACVHPWVGRSVTQLEREMGRPRSIRTEGDNRIYVYPDTLAGRGQMTFTVDRKGIIRDWNASTDVPGAFGNDVFVDGADATGGVGTGTAGGNRGTVLGP